MKKQGKILLTNVNADKNREQSIREYQNIMAAALLNYSTIKLSMNLFTMYEMSEEISLSSREEIEDYIDRIATAIRELYVEEKVSVDTINMIIESRDKITERMGILTSFTDSLEIYEYIINRQEAEFSDTSDREINTQELAERMYEFVFSGDQNDKLLINSRIQEIVAQLPVRMTNARFFDIIGNSMSIYRGGEKSSVDGFRDAIREASMLGRPEGFTTAFPEIYEIFKEFENTDYKNFTEDDYKKLSKSLMDITDIIQDYVSSFLMISEIINDVLISLYTNDFADKSYLKKPFEVSKKILSEIISAEDIYAASDSFDSLFVEIEGEQENAYDVVLSLESGFEELYDGYYDSYTDEIKNRFDLLYKADRLTSSSLYMDIDTPRSEITVVSDEADEAYIEKLKSELEAELTEHFKNVSRPLKRSIMAKVLSLMPVFFNSPQEIKEYFEFALNSCANKNEIIAVNDLFEGML